MKSKSNIHVTRKGRVWVTYIEPGVWVGVMGQGVSPWGEAGSRALEGEGGGVKLDNIQRKQKTMNIYKRMDTYLKMNITCKDQNVLKSSRNWLEGRRILSLARG